MKMIRRINSIILTLTLLLVPVVARGEDPRSSSQKGIGYSTDVLAIGLPLTAIGYTLITKDWTGLKQGAFTAAATLGSTLILKHTIHKRRPDGSDSHSFPSMHTSVSFASAAYLQRRYGWKWGIPAYAAACYVGWGRTYAKKHDWWDVVAGAALGAGSAYIFTRPFSAKHNLSLMPLSDGNFFYISASLDF